MLDVACGGSVPLMRIGDPVIHQGKRYVLRGLDPMGLPERNAELEDPKTGRRIRVPVADVRSV